MTFDFSLMDFQTEDGLVDLWLFWAGLVNPSDKAVPVFISLYFLLVNPHLHYLGLFMQQKGALTPLHAGFSVWAACGLFPHFALLQSFSVLIRQATSDNGSFTQVGLPGKFSTVFG